MLGCSLWGSAPPTPTGERRGAGWVELLLLLPVLSGWTLAQQPVGCPESCECSEAARTVKCINKNLTEVPRDLPHYVQNLFLTGNNISSLLPGAFLLSGPLLELSHLNLRGNQLECVEAHAFAGLPSLKQLDLSDNSLALLSPMALGNTSSPLEELNLSNSLRNHRFVNLLANLLQQGTLPNLRRLDLSDNHLLYLPVGMFSSLPSLQHLDLHNNSLVSLHNVSFQGLRQLRSVDLSDNSLKHLRNSTLLQLRGLTTLSLGHNTWVCDCNIEDLVTWLKESNNQVEAKETLKCSSPDQMQNSSLVKIDLSDLNCSEPTDSQAQLQTSYVFLGIVLALIGAIFLLVLYLNRKGIKKWMYNIRDACRDHMEGYHYRYEINADPRLTNLSSNSDV